MLTAPARKLIAQFPLGFVATVDADGCPAVSPKGTFLVLDDTTLGFGNIRSPGTVANLRANPACEVNFVDPFLRKGLRARGTARIIGLQDPGFESIARWRAVWGDLADRITDLVLITVTAVKPLSTPPYDDGATEEDMLATYKAKYAEIYP
ncbi:pyridoxamine 5'-phosphate oxidase family protein [Thalassococcus sp. BH17M4-6]|uniref:pyridoxamine 5'-phosphate oxidase family protein n=1 Tax=Thalassococcus sp. BH17M4-6 TaxID=3413148 RepID=UPI003BBEAA98